ncbi:MAG: EAL domain-containing protein [Rhodocyclaceae bacterium]|nr:MAG: EAL domain-containing protein [Rhodocyclaceae bacterium]
MDQLLFHEPAGTVGTLAPGRMAPTSALCFLFIGVALLVNGESRQGARLVFALAVSVALLALIGGLGFVYAAPQLSGLGYFTQMAVHTVVAFLMLALGTLCLAPDRGLIALLRSRGADGVVARGLLPVAVLLPIALELLREAGERAGLIEAEFGAVLFSCVEVLLFSALIAWVARAIAKTESERGRMQEAVRKSDVLYRSLFENMLEGYSYCHMLFVNGEPRDFVYLKVNAAFETLTGLKDVVGRKVSEVIPGIHETSPELFEIYGRVSLSGKAERFEMFVEAMKMWFSVSVYSHEREYFVAVFEVVTARKLATEALEREKTRLAAILETASDGIHIVDAEGVLVDANEAFLNLLGYDRTAIGRLHISDWDAQLDEEAIRETIKNLISQGDTVLLETRHRRRDGRIIDVEVGTRPIRMDGKDYIYASSRDITERKRADEAFRLADRVFRSTAEGIAVTDADANIVAVNPAFEAITGYSQAEVLGRNPRMLQAGRQDPAFYRDLWAGLLANGQWRGEIWNRRKNGDAYPEWLTLSAVKDAQGGTSHYVGVFSDISSIREAQQQIEFLTHHDALTHLPNRALLKDRLNQSIQRAQREGHPLALLNLGLDHFKNINETLGHAVGDAILEEVTRRLAGATRAGDTLARLAGDEFVLLLEGDVDMLAQQVAVAKKLLELFATPLHIDGHQQEVTASIGISLYPTDGTDADTLLKHANHAMHNAKANGRNTYRFFDPVTSAGVLERLLMGNALRGALAQNQLLFHYQPQVDLYSGEIVCLEALLRWQHPDRGLLLPGEFMAVAEETGLVVPIGAWALRTVCRQLKTWHVAGHTRLRVAINFSAVQFARGTLVETMRQELRDSGLDGHCVELELNESLVMVDFLKTQALLKQLKNLGVGLAIDNFGLGHSSLSYLKHFPIDRLKIDKSFIRGIVTDLYDASIVQAIIAMGHGLHLKIVAEGVETEAQLGYLRNLHCDEMQGFHFCRALPAEEIPAFLDTQLSLVTSPEAGGGRVLLLVDDEANVLAALKRLLRRDGYRILTAASAEEGLELLAQHEVGVLLSDQRMPGLSGTEFLSRVKVMYPRTIRLILSGYTDVDSITESVNKGEVYRFLTKPWEDEPLREVLKEAFMHYETSQDTPGAG